MIHVQHDNGIQSYLFPEIDSRPPK